MGARPFSRPRMPIAINCGSLASQLSISGRDRCRCERSVNGRGTPVRSFAAAKSKPGQHWRKSNAIGDGHASQKPCHNKNPPYRAKRRVTAKRQANPNRAFGVTYAACGHISAGFSAGRSGCWRSRAGSAVLLSGRLACFNAAVKFLELSRELADITALTSMRFNTKR